MAVNFVLNYEEGSEYSIDDGDGHSDAVLTEVAQARVPQGMRDLGAESMFEYGSRVGFWRLYRLFRDRGLPLTVFAAALALERNPAAAHAIAATDWDVVCHGWRWVEQYLLDEATERDHICRAHESVSAADRSRAGGLVLPLCAVARTRAGWSWSMAASATTATPTTTSCRTG